MERLPKIVFLLNPLSRDGDAQAKWTEIKTMLEKLKFEYQLLEFTGDLSQKTIEFLNSEKPDSNVVLAGIGGDGTHCAIVNGIMRFHEKNPSAKIPPYSIIPLGTANNIAKSFNIGDASKMTGNVLARALKAAIYGANFNIDIAKIGDRFFIDDFSAGFDASVLAGRDKDKKAISEMPILKNIIKGYAIYFINVIKSLLNYAPVEISVESEGKQVFNGQAMNIVVNNTRIYAGEFDFTDSAIANDGLLDILIFTGRRDYFKRYVFGGRFMPHSIRKMAHRNHELIQHFKSRSFKIISSSPLPFQTDGEFIGNSKEFSISMIAQALTIKIPVEPA